MGGGFFTLTLIVKVKTRRGNVFGTGDRIRTYNIQIRSLILYPIELHQHIPIHEKSKLGNTYVVGVIGLEPMTDGI